MLCALVYFMINKDMFTHLREEVAAADAQREQVILSSRKIIQLSKRIIYALHRGEDVADMITSIREKMSVLPESRSTSMGLVAAQEYVEALAYYYYLTEQRLVTPDELGVSAEAYLLGLCDLAGELVRRAVHDSLAGKRDSVVSIKNFLGALYAEFLQFDLRNSELRKKVDSVKWHLHKLEDLLLTR